MSETKYSFLKQNIYEEILEKYAEKELFTYVENDKTEQLTGKALKQKVNGLCRQLQLLLEPTQRAIVLLPQGLEFVVAILACFQANVVAIPVGTDQIADKESLDRKILHIKEDANVACIITNSFLISLLEEGDTYKECVLINAENTEISLENEHVAVEHDMDDVALLLYTSGSSAMSKGVMLTHANVLHTANNGRESCDITEQSVIVSWASVVHSFGFFINMLSPLLAGAKSVLFSAETFIKNPVIWFELLSKYHATHTTASNFAFEYCCSSIEIESVKHCSLSSIKGIFCAGEVVRLKTIENFMKKFKALGLPDRTFCPLYGMSEGGSLAALKAGEEVYSLYLDVSELKKQKIKVTDDTEYGKSVVSCGEIRGNFEFAIVNLERMQICQEDEIGEIWVKGPSIAKGYLNQEEETKAVMNQTINQKTGYLRTGDLGFIRDNHIFIIGRQKEVMIINGKNYYQVDLETTIKGHIPEFVLPLCVFSCDIEDEERVVVVAEVEETVTKEKMNALVTRIRECISIQYQVAIYDIVFVVPKTIPRTDSGKIQRKKCCNLYMENKLEGKIIQAVQDKEIQTEKKREWKTQLHQKVEVKLRNEILKELFQVDLTVVNKIERLSELGFNSLKYIELSKKIQEGYGVESNPIILFRCGSIHELAEYIAEQIQKEPELHDRMQKQEQDKVENIVDVSRDYDAVAIVGMACHFPGDATDPEKYWKNILENRDCITPIEDNKRLVADYNNTYDTQKERLQSWGGFLADRECFDAQFFGISPLEAECMDPQQRKAMELVWSTIEDAGYNPKALAGSNTGIFFGVHTSDYTDILARTNGIIDTYGAYIDTGLHMSILPNRVSRWFDFHGPSEVYNTACSSSLTALHHAVESIRQGECQMAVAGGINLIAAARTYMAGNYAGMFSEDGRCKTFDEQADGFVRSEGYGAVLLKPLKDAIEDKCMIYGILKGSMINHDGQSNSLRAPNLNAQKQLIVSAYQKADIPVKTVTNIEMHGTGTSLGDPIEYEALKSAFEELGVNGEAAFCALNSVKTMIGHSESASGIAGVIRVLLSMREGVLPANLHFHKLNPYISLEHSPFYYVAENTIWNRLQGEDGKSIPRRAGISSFGMGGSNAHVIIEEYNQNVTKNSLNGKVLIPFSARTRESLSGTIEKMLAYIKEKSQELDLVSLSYTLLAGRCPMAVRKAFVVESIEELENGMSEFLAKKEWGVKKSEEGQENVEKWIEEKNYEALAAYWEAGGEFQYTALFEGMKSVRLHLPTYAFEKKKYWITEGKEKQDKGSYIHPVLQQNTSNFLQQKFTSYFGEELFFVKDHKINNCFVLPGVIIVEMARTAFLESMADCHKDDSYVVQIKNMVWHKSVFIRKEKEQVNIALTTDGEGQAFFEIYGENDIVCSEGTAAFVPGVEQHRDIIAERRDCMEQCISGRHLYTQFANIGIEYGESFQKVQEVWIGKSKAVARICLSEEKAEELDVYQIYPGAADAALQACVSLMQKKENSIILPYGIEEVTILHSCSRNMWACICQSDRELPQNMVQFDIDLCDEDGNVCIQYRKVQLVITKRENYGTGSDTESVLQYFQPEWREKEQAKAGESIQAGRNILFVVEPDEIAVKKLQDMKDKTCILLQTEKESVSERCKSYALQIFHEMQTIMKQAAGKHIFVQYVISVKEHPGLYTSLWSMLKTVTLENPNIQTQMIGLDTWSLFEEAFLKTEAVQNGDTCIKYEGGKRYVREWNPVTCQNDKKETIWKDNGVYLVTGGMGGIGQAVAKDIARKTKNSVLILAGRSALQENREQELKRLREQGATVVYRSVNVSDYEQVRLLIKEIVEQYGSLNGVIHGAGIIRDSYVIKKTDSEFHEVMKAKVDGVVNLDKATRELPLDFFILFSSVSGCLGNVGQIDYAFSNAFMDGYALERCEQEKSTSRKGKMLAISWPLWKDGGIQVEKETESLLQETMGITKMSSDIGIQALYDCFHMGQSHVLVMHGIEHRIHQVTKEPVLFSRNRKQRRNEDIDKKVRKKAVMYFKNLLSTLLKLPVDQIEETEDIGDYGIDSVMMMQLDRELEKDFGPLPKTIFFEYHTVSEIADYFVEEYREKMEELADLNEETAKMQKTVAYPARNRSEVKRHRSRFMDRKTEETKKEDIAIIGLAGHYAEADTLEEFWSNLCNGKDCITEVPQERWDHTKYFSTDKNESGKTYTKWGGFLKNIEQFDPLFFQISPKEAQKMDPQERLFLQCVEETIEDAGYTKHNLADYQYGKEKGKVGVFVGAMFQEYQIYGAQMTILGQPDALYGTLSSIANRISYYYNLHGPSFTVDTMCSSSLTALHVACESIRKGECSLAIAGGVNVSVHPNKYIVLAQGKFASPTGRCRAFGEEADGYVPGEGVGAVLLKPLSQAVKDGDHIYGLIKATAINHGGKVSGITVPNPVAQTDVIMQALQNADMNPRRINYVEAHGTGTILGDPIEVNALTKAYQNYTSDRQFCRIGSVKSNIGHCESAAGMASLTKVLLQMKYGKLVPSIHSEHLNPNIDFTQTPFEVQHALEDWERVTITADGVEKECPRCAGISAFGAGGSNAHVIIEEYVAEDTADIKEQEKELLNFLFSARNKKELKELCKKYIRFLQTEAVKEEDLIRVVYTLQTGRNCYDERLAFHAESVKELEEKLTKYIEDVPSDELVQGNARENGMLGNLLGNEEEVEEEIALWIQKRKYKKLSGLWVMGCPVDWSSLYEGKRIEKISMPSYPFAMDRYWFPDQLKQLIKKADVSVAHTKQLHPLLHTNTSLLDEQRFTSTFTGEEFFLRDHVVNGRKMLPGAAYLEMVRAAVEHSMRKVERNAIQIRHVKWLRALTAGEQGVKAHIGLFRQSDNRMSFDVYNEKNSFCQGEVIIKQQESQSESINIKEVIAQCSHKVIGKEECYRLFEKRGIVYGEQHRGIQCIYEGEQKVLAKIALDTATEEYELHPGIVDAAIQSAVGLVLKEGTGELKLPSTLGQLDIYGKTGAYVYAFVTVCDAANQQEDSLHVDLAIYNDSGEILVKMTDLCFRSVGRKKAEPEKQKKNETLLFHNEWVASEMSTAEQKIDRNRIVVWCGNPEETIDASRFGCRLIPFDHKEQNVAKDYQRNAIELFGMIKNILQEKTEKELLIQMVMQEEDIMNAEKGLAGLLKTAHLENPGIQYQLIEVSKEMSLDEIAEKLECESQQTGESEIKYQNHIRYTKKRKDEVVSRKEPESEQPMLPWKEKGVYLITGGVGGLGLIFANEIVSKVKTATVVLAGRSELNEEKKKAVEELERQGAEVVYKKADITDYAQTQQLINFILNTYGALDGVLHCAGIIRDNFIIQKTEEEFLSVLQPKVWGTVNLEQCTRQIPMDFLVLFSSQSGEEGNAGQADYATGNAFMDAVANYQDSCGSSRRILSINWPLWEQGGMQVPKQVEDRMYATRGMIPLKTRSGLDAFYLALQKEYAQVMVLEGNADKIRNQKNPETETKKKTVLSERETQDVKEKAQSILCDVVADVMKLPSDKIDISEELGNYGLDSVMIMDMTDELEHVFGTLPKTLFFEYQTVKQLAEYFVTNYAQKLKELSQTQTSEKELESVWEEEAKMETDYIPERPERKIEVVTEPGKREDIAIIGVAGHYPESDDLNEFWEHLCQGKDCITEIPEERWDHSLYFSPDKEEMGKTYTKWGGFLKKLEYFDPLFFNISPAKAELMDPQERLFLQCVQETIEDAGYSRETLSAYQYGEEKGQVGVFVGAMYEEYQMHVLQAREKGGKNATAGMISTIANWVSYFYNLHGPCIAMDTMCSSALTAVHLACESIHNGQCGLAIAGGVNVSVHPNKYLMLAQDKFASSVGRCKAFAEGGDGYVPGEGVGALLLKPLSRAVADKDHIYGVIKATAVNHGGRTSGFTVPNPVAQSEVVQTAFKLRGIDPRTISYVEAHGTGTSLGDPIEIKGLLSAFEKHTKDRQFCRIGSVKSNIGHCESASGVASITKVLLQFKHKMLVPSIHAEKLNPYIQFEETPFVVQRKLEEWKTDHDLPRRALVSAFGAGGSNACVILEEYEKREEDWSVPEQSRENSEIILLSAKSEEQVKEAARRLLHYLETEDIVEADLKRIAYTLQTGRSFYEIRLAIQAESIQQLKDRLNAYERGEGAGYYYTGDDTDNVTLFEKQNKDDKEAVQSMMQEKNYKELLSLWVNGLNIAWSDYRSEKIEKISLPAYPFQMDRYWFPDTFKALRKEDAVTGGQIDRIHPLLHKNESSLYEQKFTSEFTGEEFFLRDHVVKGRKILPAAAYVEMARAALEKSLPESVGQVIHFKNVKFQRAFQAGEEARTINTTIGGTKDVLHFDIYAIKQQTICQGNLQIAKKPDKQETVDLYELKKQFQKGTIDKESLYQMYENMGISYGARHKGIVSVMKGSQKALAQLSIPQPEEGFYLHVGLVDSAIQAAIGVLEGNKDLMLPYGVEEIEIYDRTSEEMWVQVTKEDGDSPDVQNVNIIVYDQEGKVTMQMHHFCFRKIEKAALKPKKGYQICMLQPVWKKQERK